MHRDNNLDMHLVDGGCEQSIVEPAQSDSRIWPEDRITIGALTASRIVSVPSDARRRWAHSATIIEIETGRDYHVSGGTDWFEIHEGVVFTVRRTATVAWAEGTAKLEAGMWVVRMV